MSRKILISLALAAIFGASAQAEEFTVGAHMPLTGSLARSGQAFNEGMQAAVKLFNERGGKHTIKLEVVDDESAPAKAVGAVEKLAGDGAVAIIGGYGSNIIGPASDTADKLGLTYMTAGGVSSALVERGLKTFFRINNEAGYHKSLGILIDEIKPKSVSIIYNTKETPTLIAKAMEAELQTKGITFTSHAFDPAITDFKPIVNKVKLRDKSELILMLAYETDYIGILRAAKLLKPDVKAIVGVWSLATRQMAEDFPDLMPNVIGTATLSWPTEFKTDEGKRFQEIYKQLYGRDVDYLASYSFVESMLLFNAIEKVADRSNFSKAALPEELRKTDAETIIGRVAFNEKGDNPEFAQGMAQHQDGKIPLVSPAVKAAAPLILPARPW
jgi:branched-chain amino acid transport system substrate-binding protein